MRPARARNLPPCRCARLLGVRVEGHKNTTALAAPSVDWFHDTFCLTISGDEFHDGPDRFRDPVSIVLREPIYVNYRPLHDLGAPQELRVADIGFAAFEHLDRDAARRPTIRDGA
jgi:hypothetical protein